MGPSLEIGPFGQSVGLFQMHCYASGFLNLIKWEKGSSGKRTNKFIMYIRNIEEDNVIVLLSHVVEVTVISALEIMLHCYNMLYKMYDKVHYKVDY